MESSKEGIIKQLSNMSKDELIEIFIYAVEEIELLTKKETALNFLDSIGLANKNE